MLSFHRVMTIIYIFSSYLQLWNLRISQYTYAEIQALWLVEKTITKIEFWCLPFRQGENKNGWAYISKDFIANSNFIAPFSAKIKT